MYHDCCHNYGKHIPIRASTINCTILYNTAYHEFHKMKRIDKKLCQNQTECEQYLYSRDISGSPSPCTMHKNSQP